MVGHASHVAGQTGADASGDEGGAAGAKISTGAPRAPRTSISPRPTTTSTGRAASLHCLHSDTLVHAADLDSKTATAAVTVFLQCKSGRRDGGGSRHVDGGRSAGRFRGPSGSRRSPWPERYHMDQTVRRRTALPHDGQELTGTFRGLRRHRGGRRHHGQTDQQKQRIRLCEFLF